MRGWTHLYPVFELDFATSIDGDMFKSLSRLVVRFSAVLKCLEDSGFVYATWGICTDGTVDEITQVNM